MERADSNCRQTSRSLGCGTREGEEGTFLLCTFWLAQALALGGEVGRAREVFTRAVGFANDPGLLAEEVDGNGELLGNYSHAFSHIGLVNAASAMAEYGGERVRELGRDPAMWHVAE